MIHREKDAAGVDELRRVREEAGKRDVDTKVVVDRAKKMAEESNKKMVEVVRGLGSAQVEKVELAKEDESLRTKGAWLSDENARLQRVLENAC